MFEDTLWWSKCHSFNKLSNVS